MWKEFPLFIAWKDFLNLKWNTKIVVEMHILGYSLWPKVQIIFTMNTFKTMDNKRKIIRPKFDLQLHQPWKTWECNLQGICGNNWMFHCHVYLASLSFSLSLSLSILSLRGEWNALVIVLCKINCSCTNFTSHNLLFVFAFC